MQEIAGQLHDGATTRRHAATMRIYPDGSVRIAMETGELALRIEELEIAARLGNTPRSIGLPDGAEFETLDNDSVDAALSAHARSGRNWIHHLENRLGLVLVATAIVLVSGAAFAVWGIPALAREAAFAMSPDFSSRIGAGTLQILDQTLEPSELDEQRRAQLDAHFQQILEGAPEGYDYRLLFRGGGGLGANAFALPSGAVLVTDELIGLAERDEELIGVLAHEVGHVVHRHGLRGAIQSSLLAIGILLVTGDLSSTSGFVAALPTVLAESRFSREFEREADDYAASYLAARAISPAHFAALLRRLADEHDEADGVVPFLSTHPATNERIERLGG